MSELALKDAIEEGSAFARLLERGGFDETLFDRESAEKLHGVLCALIGAARVPPILERTPA